MHASVMQFVGGQVERLDLANKAVLEVGSLNVNGSVRGYFRGEYVGVDMQKGLGVDVQLNAHELVEHFGKERFDVVVCTEMLEHDTEPWTSVQQMAQVTRPGACLLLTARGYDERGCFPLHSYPHDLWRFSTHGLQHLIRACGWDPQVVAPDPEAPGVFAVGGR